ncbi:FERM domain-containing protein 4A-like [Oscarella lobularis]|uniref:FERM domain-containing protein 4A-like n=1 Tax=Oscarella lobularis TaxID=121494 RepID=UPI0033131ABC
MSDKGRKGIVYLLDDTQMEITIAPALLAQELLDMAASHFQLKEKEYFGLTVDSPHDAMEYVNWLQNEKPVLDQDIPPVGMLKLYFTVKHFVERVDLLRDPITVELFYLQAKQSVFKGSLPCESDIVFFLAAQSLQVYAQDFTTEELAREDLKRISWLPARTLKEHVSIPYCENKVLSHYKKLIGKSRGSAILNYLNTSMTLPSYGIHYFQVKDNKKENTLWLGFGARGIGLYDLDDKIRPREFHTWKHLDNIHYRDKRFTIEIYDSRSGGGESSRRGGGASSCTTKAWHCSSMRMAQALFSMAIQQHQFWRDKKSLKKTVSYASNRLTDLSRMLSRTCLSLSSASSVAGSQISLPAASNKASAAGSDEVSAAAKRANTEMFLQLKARRSQLQEELTRREQELRGLCIRESELCGHVSLDLHASPDHPDISIKRRIGTSYKFPDHVFKSPEAEANEEITKLEKDIEIQFAITNAAEKIAREPTKSQKVRKERYTTVKRSKAKLQTMQLKLGDMKESLMQLPPQYLPRLVPTGAPVSTATTPNGAFATRDITDTPGTLSKTSSYSSLVSTQSKSAATSSSRDALLDSVTEDIVANLIAGNRTVTTGNEPLGNGGLSGSGGMGGSALSSKRHNSLSRLALGSTSPVRVRHVPGGMGSLASTSRLHRQSGGGAGSPTKQLASSLDELSRDKGPDDNEAWSPRSLTFSDGEVEWMSNEFGEGTLV